MMRISNLKAPLDFDAAQAAKFLAAQLKLPAGQVSGVRLVKKAVDARSKSDIHFVLTLDFELGVGKSPTIPKGANVNEVAEQTYTYPSCPPLPHRPLVVGLGPAGLMAALILSEAGLKPLVVERGRDVDSRARDVARFFDTGDLNPQSNVQFGEGGAGTFSDGKLTTGIKDVRCHQVLNIFHEHGAPEEILYQAKPHIGTDNLPGMVRSIRQKIVALGGEVCFETRLTDIILGEGRVVGAVIETSDGTERQIDTQSIVLAIGHSARDTYEMLHHLGIPMEKKPFSIGVRIEHSQKMIDHSQYGAIAGHKNLGAADYKLNERLKNGRGIYTFCMCPGGTVVAAASEPAHLVVNGMSAFARDGENANSALLVGVTPEDFPGDSPLSGLRFQEHWEHLAFLSGGGNFKAPAQLAGDFLKGTASKCGGEIHPTYRPGVTWTDLSQCLPKFATEALKEGLTIFDRRLKGFASKDAVLTGVETRSSAPLTILRTQECMSQITGLYPCGEGAGYAGGIMSAAVDGIRCAESLIAQSNPPQR